MSSTHQLPFPSILRDGVSFFSFLLHNNLMNILQKIFTDYYEQILYTLHPRQTEIENINKMIHCGDPSFCGAMYACPHCDHLKFVPFRCHSRFCPTCGNKYAMQRTTSMSFKLIAVRHRHCVFTIDEILRDFFLKDRSLLDCLFHAVNSVVSRMFFKTNKSKNFTPGFIMVSILLAVILNGILISTVLFLKAALATMLSGATFIILITPSSEMRFVPPCSIYFSKNLAPLLKLLKPFATLNINMAFMFMLNLISVTQKLSLNTLADILDALLSLLPESIITMADRLLFIITATKMNSMFRKPFLSLFSSKGSSAISLKNISK